MEATGTFKQWVGMMRCVFIKLTDSSVKNKSEGGKGIRERTKKEGTEAAWWGVTGPRALLEVKLWPRHVISGVVVLTMVTAMFTCMQFS